MQSKRLITNIKVEVYLQSTKNRTLTIDNNNYYHIGRKCRYSQEELSTIFKIADVFSWAEVQEV